MKIGVPAEIDGGESRVAATAETVKRYVGLGATVTVETGAGIASGIVDAAYEAAGAVIAADAAAAVADADVVLKVRRPIAAELPGYKRGALVIATMDPYGHEDAVRAMAEAGVTGFAMEFMPRITRAQSMDVLSSQANLAGYQAVIDAAASYDRALPMMMTAAGTVPAARVFVMGAGVAGLQAIATARRLGAVVTATDVRPAAKEQVESLGAKFVAVEDEEFRQAETAGGYAKPMSAEYQSEAGGPGRRAHQEAGHRHHHRADPRPGGAAAGLGGDGRLDAAGRGAGRSRGRARRQCRGLAPRRGGRCRRPRIVGHLNVAGRIPATASQLYARNLAAFLETLVDKASKALGVNHDDELVKATMLTRDGAVAHPAFAPKPEAVETASEEMPHVQPDA